MKQFLLLLLTLLAPIASMADTWQDPETKVNYAYFPGYEVAGVASSNPVGDITILSTFTVDGKEYHVTSIANRAFKNCSNMTSITIPNTITTIGKEVFYGCASLKNITIPNFVTSIEERTFYGCTALQSIDIPNSVTNIKGYAFSGCTALQSIGIPNSVTSIEDAVFQDCTSLHSIDIPNSVTSIGIFAFDGCISLQSIDIPNSVTSIGNFAFDDCISLQSIDIPNSVTSIGGSAFYGCISLQSIDIPNSVTSIGSSAFNGCTSLQSIDIPNSVTSIGNYAFYGCTSLQSIDIPNSVTSIGNYAFYGCTSLQSINIPNSVTTIEEYAFYGCTSLTSITMPNSVTSIGYGAFQECISLQSIDIPNSVTSIGDFAFGGCTSLQSIEISNSVTTIGYHAFDGCISLQSINIPNSVTTIEEYAFSGCTSLASITIPSSVTSIGMMAFHGCTSLTSITMPNSVTSINYGAFQECSSLTSITSEIMEPFIINSSVFDINTRKNATLYVPNGTSVLYRLTEGWDFTNIVEENAGTTVLLNVIDENGSDLTETVNIIWFDADGQQIGVGKSLSGVTDSTEVHYSVLLNENLGRIYREVKMRKVVAETDTIVCQLDKIGRIRLEGRVSATNIEKKSVTVNIKQMLNGKWEQDYTTQTNEQGVFQVEVYDDETDITISGDGYFDASLHRDGFSGNGNIGTIPLNLISGFALAANITMKKAMATGETKDVSEWSGSLNNIEFELYNVVKGTDISDFTLQNGNVIIKTGAEIGDEIRLTAKSKQNIFADASTAFSIAEGANSFSLALTELGGIDATYTSSSNSSTIGYLYDANSKLIAKGSYIGEKLSLRHLQSGTYTLITMGSSTLLGNMPSLASLDDVGLHEGSDYVATNVVVTDGLLTGTTINEVPRMDDTRFYYTSGDTYFNANKESLTAGNYLTLNAHLDFKPEYSDKTDVVRLSIDIPDGCQVVENSVIANRQAVVHTIDGNRLMMTLNKEQWQGQIRFCVIPVLNQTYTLTAMASFDIDGNISQPIGTAQFEAKGLSLSTPKLTANTNITINGTAKGHSEISIYDNDVLIGKTSSKADGSWTATCELYKPYTHSFHDIYAKITTVNGMELTSETKQVEYEKNVIAPEKVTMLYYNPEVNKNYNIVFDLIYGTTAPSSYYYFPYKNWPNWYETLETEPKDFTFLADFTRNDSTLIKNVNIKVLNSDGTVRTLPAVFDGKQNKWVATTKYSSSSRLPRNVAVEYVLNPTEKKEYDSTCAIDDRNQKVNMILNYVMNVDTTKIDVIDADESMIICTYQTYTMEKPLYMKLTELNYDQHVGEMEQTNYFTIESEHNVSCMVDSVIGSEHVFWIWSPTDRQMVQIELAWTNEFKDLNNAGTQNHRRILGFVIDAAFTIQDIRSIINEYNSGYNEYQNWLRIFNRTTDEHFKMYNRTCGLLEAKCPNGELRLSSSAYFNFKSALSNRFELANIMRQQFKLNLDRVEHDLLARRNNSIAIATALSALSAIIPGSKAALKLSAKLGAQFLKKFNKAIPLWLLQQIAHGANSAGSNIGSDLANAVLNGASSPLYYTTENLSNWYHSENLQICEGYLTIQNSIQNSYKKCEKEKEKEKEKENEEEKDEPCNEDSDNKDDFNGQGTTPINDPSGYVYEAVLSNRLEGVTATCYQKVQKEDMYGDLTEEAEMWNAEDYSQQNPLKTDAYGFYRWDVPQGMWQVKYEKEGYETAYSEWLPVPPPQLDVNIGMKQSTPPTVKQMRGYESGINIETSKYMRPATLNTTNVIVTRNGMEVKGSIDVMNAEKEPRGDAVFASKIKFIPEINFETTDEVIVTVHKEVESYCGVNMIDDHVQKVKIESEIEEIVADSAISVSYQGTKEIQIVALPKAAAIGKTLQIQTSSSMIASLNTEEITLDKNGSATLTLNGELPGSAFLTFTIKDTDVTALSRVKVTSVSDMVATPLASIRSGESVDAGTLLTLTCETEGATIYYTLDGSCPCDETKKIKYEAPIIINSDVIVKAIAVKDDMDDSDIATFVYLIDVTTGNASANISGIRIWPYVTSSAIHIDMNGLKAESITVVNMNGTTMYSASNAKGLITIDLGKHEDGMYIVNVKCKDGRIVRKIVKIRNN